MRRTFGIRYKITIFTVIVSVVMGVVILGLTYYWGSKFVKRSVSEERVQMASLISESIIEILEENISDIAYLSTLPGVRESVKAENSKRYGAGDSALQEFTELEKKWLSLGPDDHNVKRFTDTELVSGFLEPFMASNVETKEMMVTDKRGWLIASNEKTTDLFQADETWWNATYGLGRGNTYVGDVVYDESSDTVGIEIAVPVKDDKGDVIGIMMSVVDVSKIFEVLDKFSVGSTGHASLVDKRGFIIYHKGIKPLSLRACNENEWNELLKKRSSQIVLETSFIHKQKVLAFFEKVSSDKLRGIGVGWYVLIGQDYDEAMAPFRELRQLVALVFLVLLAVLLIFGAIFAKLFIKPLAVLSDSVEKIGSGDLGYRVDVKTGDEIEGLAVTLNRMRENIASSTTSIDNLKQEIEQRKKIEGELKESTDFAEMLFQVSPSAIFVVDTKRRIKKFNKFAELMTGYKQEEVLGKECMLFTRVPCDERCGVFEGDSDKPIFQVECSIQRKDGAYLTILKNADRIKDKDGKVIGAIESFVDITERKRAETVLTETKHELEDQAWGLAKTSEAIRQLYKELEKKNMDLQKLDKLKSDFISIVSHELRTPLAITKEGISLVIDRIPGEINQKQEKILKTSMSNIDRLARIINDILDISKIEAGKMEMKKEKMSLNALVDSIILGFENKARVKGLELKKNMPVGEIFINADPDRITQVFTNLVNNAIKFTDKGSIEIACVDTGAFAECSVKDTGIGIREENLKKVFNKFQQFGRSDGGGEKGTGLGLSISKSLVELHGGQIRVESVFGKGTSFIFAVPKNLG